MRDVRLIDEEGKRGECRNLVGIIVVVETQTPLTPSCPSCGSSSSTNSRSRTCQVCTIAYQLSTRHSCAPSILQKTDIVLLLDQVSAALPWWGRLWSGFWRTTHLSSLVPANAYRKADALLRCVLGSSHCAQCGQPAGKLAVNLMRHSQLSASFWFL